MTSQIITFFSLVMLPSGEHYKSLARLKTYKIVGSTLESKLGHAIMSVNKIQLKMYVCSRDEWLSSSRPSLRNQSSAAAICAKTLRPIEKCNIYIDMFYNFYN